MSLPFTTVLAIVASAALPASLLPLALHRYGTLLRQRAAKRIASTEHRYAEMLAGPSSSAAAPTQRLRGLVLPRYLRRQAHTASMDAGERFGMSAPVEARTCQPATPPYMTQAPCPAGILLSGSPLAKSPEATDAPWNRRERQDAFGAR